MPAAPLSSNRLLRGLPGAEFALLSPLVRRLELGHGTEIGAAGGAVPFAVFPESGVISLVAPVEPAAVLELALLGHEGMFGLSLSCGIQTSSMWAVVQSDSVVVQIGSASFRKVLRHCPTLTKRISRYGYRLMLQVSQTAICNGAHTIEARAARWMLTMSDRVRHDEFRMKQAFLADMLGVQRPAISHAARGLLDGGLVRYSRGIVRIVDRHGLESVACRCYRVLDDLYRAALR